VGKGRGAGGGAAGRVTTEGDSEEPWPSESPADDTGPEGVGNEGSCSFAGARAFVLEGAGRNGDSDGIFSTPGTAAMGGFAAVGEEGLRALEGVGREAAVGFEGSRCGVRRFVPVGPGVGSEAGEAEADCVDTGASAGDVADRSRPTFFPAETFAETRRTVDLPGVGRFVFGRGIVMAARAGLAAFVGGGRGGGGREARDSLASGGLRVRPSALGTAGPSEAKSLSGVGLLASLLTRSLKKGHAGCLTFRVRVPQLAATDHRKDSIILGQNFVRSIWMCA